jgi:Beta-ketoacyl synthase, N-terminal domain
MMRLSLFVDGIALWAPEWPNWSTAQEALLGKSAHVDGLNLTPSPFHAPSPSLLTPAERRRAPATVALALEVATAAAAMSGLNAAELNTVFTSVHGDLAINHAMCRALIEAPLLVSPTKFINSVHNAPAGYWAIATGCRQTSTALSAFDQSFTAGLFEAALQAVADDQTVLLVGYDMAASGPLADVAQSRGPLAVGLVLSPRERATSKCVLTVNLRTLSDAAPTPCRSAASSSLASYGMKEALPLMEALAACIRSQPNAVTMDTLVMPLSSSQALHVQLRACDRPVPPLLSNEVL